ncbi:MAG: OmpA family protein [Saprospiraceae bacterium]|nr:OmpA family protein [Saprospiraceae bacterium]
MIQKVSICLLSLCFLTISITSFSQEQEGISNRVIEDDLTLDPDQNKKWREGQHPYSAKPKSMWELGIHAGHAFISGDVEAVFPSGFGFGLHLRKAVNYVLSFRLDGWYSQSKGFDARRQNSRVMARERFYSQNPPGNLTSYVESGDAIHRNYKTSMFGGSFEAILNIGNLLFHQDRNKWNVYSLIGVGLNVPDTKIDLLNGSSPYNFSSVTSGLDLQTRSDRKESRSRLKDLLDGDYETEGGVENTIASLGDSKKVLPHFNFGVGVSRKLSQRVNLGFEYQIVIADTDLYDGFELRTEFDETNNLDVPHYASVRLGINLGDFSEKTEPLYWLNPLSGALNDLAEVKARPILDLTDSDGDGIIDMLDQEINSPDGAPVDTRGVVLDSDGDGVADYQDSEPYSAPGYDVDGSGVAQIPEDPYLTEDEINQLVNQKISNIRTNWFLPMVHFDLDKYFVKPEFYGQLHHIATVMKQHPNLQVVAKGHADLRNPNEYNTVLSFRRARAVVDYLVSKYELPRQRFLIQYGGENTPLIPDLPDSHAITKQREMQQYLNRRVEFAIAGPDDAEMAEPEGPDAGSGTPGSSRPGPKYSGNRNSGY